MFHRKISAEISDEYLILKLPPITPLHTFAALAMAPPSPKWGPHPIPSALAHASALTWMQFHFAKSPTKEYTPSYICIYINKYT